MLDILTEIFYDVVYEFREVRASSDILVHQTAVTAGMNGFGEKLERIEWIQLILISLQYPK